MKIKHNTAASLLQGSAPKRGIVDLSFPLEADRLFEELLLNAELKENLFGIALAQAGWQFSPFEIWTDGLHRLMTWNNRKREAEQQGIAFQSLTHLQKACWNAMAYAKLDLVRQQKRWGIQVQNQDSDRRIEVLSRAEWLGKAESESRQNTARDRLDLLMDRLPEKSRVVVAHLAANEDKFIKRTGTVHQGRLAQELQVNQCTVSRQLANLRQEVAAVLADADMPEL